MIRKPRTIRPSHPNAGLRVEYRRRLDAFIAEMHASYVYWVEACYTAKPPEMAQDASHWTYGMSPAKALQEALNRLARRWARRLNEFAPKLATWFANKSASHVGMNMRAVLRDAGMSVTFKTTKRVNDVLQATIGEQVALIKSIGKQYHSEIESLVMRSVAAGRDIGALSKELEARYGVTQRRAAFVARDQNSKATATITRVRQQELGIEQALWIHSSAGKTPRPSHVAMNNKPYNVATGIRLDDDPEIVWPGTAINCRCVSKAILPELGVRQ
jgi:SPP1 gp7 family putative phage head morphogenesis protein